MAAVMKAFGQRDSAAVAALVHPRAEVAPLPARTVLRGREEVIAYIEAMRDRAGAVRVHSVEELGDDGLLLEGREQWQTQDNALIDTPVVWVIRFRNRLIWRMCTYQSRAEALSADC